MRVMVFVKAAERPAGMEPTPEAMAAFAAMDRFTEELVAAGVFVAAAGLKPLAESRRIVFDGADRAIVDAVPADAGAAVAGFAIWEVRDMDDALAWAGRCPNPTGGRAEIDIRPFYEVADLAGFVSPEELAAGQRPGDRGRLGVA